MSNRVLLAAGSLLAVLASTTAFGQLTRERMATMNEAELIAVGGEPTGDMMMKAMPWPLEVLLTRDRDQVTRLAWDCLSQPPAAMYSHAFCVNLTAALDPPDLAQRLAELYPLLDAPGQYEVLLQAVDRSDVAYAGIFADIVRQLAVTRVVDKPEFLAAVFALQVYEPDLAAALSALDLTTLQTQLQPRSNVDGFPYGDVVNRSVSNPLGVISEAQAFSHGYREMLARAMTPEEAALLQTYRERLLTVQRVPFAANAGSLATVLQRMSAQYAWLNFSDIFRTLRFSELKLALPEAPRTYTEVMAEICNREFVNFYSNALVPFSWNVGPEGDASGYLRTPRCTASAGYLFSLNAFTLPGSTDRGATLSLMMTVAGPVGWLNSMADYTFELVSIEAESGSLPLTLNKGLPGTPFIRLDLGAGTPDQLGALTIRGTATLRIPTSLRIVEADIVDRGELVLTEGPMQLNYATSLEEARYDWGVAATQCCRWPGFRRPLPLSIGMVQLFDTSGILQRSPGSTGASDILRNANAFRFLDMSNASTFQPGKLVWTFAPTVEEITVPVAFENVRFIPRPPPQPQ